MSGFFIGNILFLELLRTFSLRLRNNLALFSKELLPMVFYFCLYQLIHWLKYFVLYQHSLLTNFPGVYLFKKTTGNEYYIRVFTKIIILLLFVVYSRSSN